jgi:hypothetical protein
VAKGKYALRPRGTRRRGIAAVVFWTALLFLFPGKSAALPEEDLHTCRRVVQQVHDAVSRAGVGNAAAATVSGMPFLRTDRFLAAMAKRVNAPGALAALAGRMRNLDRSSRAAEMAALGSADRKRLADALGQSDSPAGLERRYQACAAALLEEALETGAFADRIGRSASVRGEYALGYRILGIYPIAAMPVATLTRRAYDTFRSWYRTPREALPILGTLTTFAPEGSRIEPAFPAPDALGVPAPTPAQADALARFYAPVFVVDRAYEFDRPGVVALRDEKPVIEDGPPAVYTYFSHAFFRGRPVLQINYSLWFGARGGDSAPWIEHGTLDGITVRVTLDTEGRPIVVDVMNNCGCYHFFLPAKGLVTGLRDDPKGLEPLVAGALPAAFPKHPLMLRVKAGWHQVDAFWAAPLPGYGDTVGYRLLSYDALEALRSPEGAVESLFTPDGIAKGSGRIEPFLLFSMGIPDVGSMRQRGHHAIKLVGRAHFDDPYLLDKTFYYAEDR